MANKWIKAVMSGVHADIVNALNSASPRLITDFHLEFPDDEPEFLSGVWRLIIRAANAYDAQRVTVIAVDRWFGERWLGFRGKLLGRFGVRCNITSEKLSLRIPPFHPHRVRLGYTYTRTPNGFELRTDWPGIIHDNRKSESNTRMTLLETYGPGLYSWYTAGTRHTDRGSIMVYHVHPDGDVGWFVGFSRAAHWQPTHRVGLGDSEWGVLWGDDIASGYA